MLKKLLTKLKGLFRKQPAPPLKPEIPGSPGKRADVAYGDVVGNVKITRPSQLIKHTYFAPGEQYRLGEAIVTVHPNKESMLAAIAATEKRRQEKEARLTERAVDIMMMSPAELEQFKVQQFLAANKAKDTLFKRIMGRFWNKSRTNHFVQLEAKYAEPPKQNTVKEESSNTVKIQEKVH